MQPEKKQLELLLMHYFRECHYDFPKGKLAASESPDFILKLNTRKKVGIELTRLNPSAFAPPARINTTQNIVWEQVVDASKSLFEQSSPLRLFVKFQFSEKLPIEDQRILSVAARATNAIRKAVQYKKPGDFFYETITGGSLPDGIENVLLVNHPGLDVPVWERLNNLGISEDVLGDIRAAIFKKDEKLRIYQKQSLNHYWLIIIADQLQGVKNYNLHDKIENQVFHSCFQQVYLFDLVKAKVFQLV